MKRLIAKPNGWPCTLYQCPPGHLTGCGEDSGYVWFKTEYYTEQGRIMAYNMAGEFLCIEPSDMVQPIVFEWVEDGE